MMKLKYVLLLIASATFGVSSVHAANLYWTGTTDGDWSVAGNWLDSTGAVSSSAPASGDNVFFYQSLDTTTTPGSVIGRSDTSGNVSVSNFTLTSNTGGDYRGRVTIDSSVSYTINGGSGKWYPASGDRPTIISGSHIVNERIRIDGVGTTQNFSVATGAQLTVTELDGGGAGLRVTGDGTLVNTDAGFNNQAGIRIDSAATVDLPNGYLAGNTTVDNGYTAILQSSNAGSKVTNTTGTMSTLSVGTSAGASTSEKQNTFAGTIEGNLNFILKGNSTNRQTLTGTNTYAGDTTINNGAQIILAGTGSINGTGGNIVINDGTLTNDSSVAFNKSITVASGQNANLGGAGSFDGAITVQDGGELSSGASPGLLTAADLTLETNSTFNWELDSNADTVRGVNFDAVDATDLTIQSGVTADLDFTTGTVDWNDAFWSSNQSWLVFDNTNTPTLASISIFDTVNISLDSLGGDFSTILSGSSFSFRQAGNDVYLDYAAIPEPSSFALIGLGLGALYLLRRKKA